jgi:hypothetical protein
MWKAISSQPPGAVDVPGIALAARVFEVLPDHVQLDAQALDVGVGEMGKFCYICNRHYAAWRRDSAATRLALTA